MNEPIPTTSSVHSDERILGAHGGGIPPGWDFPEAHEAARQGIDLWMLDSNLQMTPWDRIRNAASAARFANMLRAAGKAKHGV